MLTLPEPSHGEAGIEGSLLFSLDEYLVFRGSWKTLVKRCQKFFNCPWTCDELLGGTRAKKMNSYF